ncbi:HXXEE domain-containing protein [Isobaculum melis]|uniref:HXXEE domain-containing protein n=1 Tax=Isobaculum melis TaxID=142588 RepID=A0A1H9RLQ1_9LACT|nr:HXXEE domain-containing protein [Isobaculum melis]SER73518.1 Protein of unknown function with HXXEE motif-containing protein [Isobaculum melis]
MFQSSFIIWILPILFMIHDFEEIIMVRAWKKRHRKKFSSAKRPFFGNTTNTAAFSIAVLEEFLLLSGASFFTQSTENFSIYFSLFLAYTLHLFVHFLMSIKVKIYVPGLLTAILQFPLCCYLLLQLYKEITDSSLTLLLTCIVCTILAFANLLLLHRLMEKFDAWLVQYGARVN